MCWTLIHHVRSDYIADNQPTRIITLTGDIGCPCGGTHVHDLREIGGMEVTKLAVKSGRTRISYRVKS